MPEGTSKGVAYNHIQTQAPNSGNHYAVIETPKGSRNKYKFMPPQGVFMLSKVLPAGAVFPYDFGFIPSTVGQDGDPLDVLIFMDQPAFTGCVLEVRLIGVMEADQTENGKTVRNDRLIAVAATSHDHQDLQSLKQVNDHLYDELVHFFVSYDQMEGKVFKPVGKYGPARAKKLVQEGARAFKKSSG